MSDPLISVKNLSRRFGKVQAVDDVSFEVKQGSIFGLLGTNGAGKTTVIRLLMGYLYPDHGEIRVLGVEPRRFAQQHLRRVAYVSDRMQLPARMRLDDVIRFNQQLFPKWNSELAEQLVKEFDVDSQAPFARLSLGQQRRSILLQAVCQGADLLVLDEPFAGLDAIFRRQCLDMLLTATVEHGVTVLVSSHLLHDVERVVDTIGMMRDGRLFKASNLEELKSGLRRVSFDSETNPADLPLGDLNVLGQSSRGNITSLVVEGCTENFQSRLNGSLGDRVRVEHMNLEDIFVELSSLPKEQSNGVTQ